MEVEAWSEEQKGKEERLELLQLHFLTKKRTGEP